MLTELGALRHQWYVVAEVTDVGDAPLAVKVLGEPIVVWRGPDGRLVAAPDRCPHREAPLSIGTVTAGSLACAYHGWTFAADGRCVLVPSSGAGRPIPPAAHLSTHHVVERYGLVWVCPGEPAGAIPHVEFEDDPAYRRINSGVETWAVNAMRMVDNFLDISHFPYVHVGTFGIQDNTEVPRIELIELDADFFGYEYSVEVANDAGSIASGLDEPVITRRMTTGFHLPFTVRSTIHYETGLDHIILLCTTPIDDARSGFTFVIWRNDDHSVPAEEVIAFDRAIGAEDKRMLERIPGGLPLDPHATVSVQSDRPSVEWRRRLTALVG
jgi:phenylpropionate dioxygenase-like ring-hydroxylating dioxygenase large terminal subunit